MTVSRKNLTDTVYAALALSFAFLQLIASIWLVSAGDPGERANHLWFALVWIISVCLLIISVVHLAEKKYLNYCILVNLAGIIGVWLVFLFFPSWVFGDYLMAYGAHGGFAIMVTFLNVLPLILCTWWYLRLHSDSPG